MKGSSASWPTRPGARRSRETLPGSTGPGLVLEADGRYKYGPEAELMTGDEHWDEKVREDDLREQGYDFRRPTWDRVWNRAAFEAMMRGTTVPRDW